MMVEQRGLDDGAPHDCLTITCGRLQSSRQTNDDANKLPDDLRRPLAKARMERRRGSWRTAAVKGCGWVAYGGLLTGDDG
eukprot:Skav207144  [mRNA]  locus=scaffold4102:89797:90841:+ [translate_table: standard]